MKLEDLIALGQQMQRWHARIEKGACNVPHPETAAFVDGALALLGGDECGWEPDMVVRLDMAHPAKAFVSIERNDLNVDEARWAALEILKAAEAAEERGNG